MERQPDISQSPDRRGRTRALRIIKNAALLLGVGVLLFGSVLIAFSLLMTGQPVLGEVWLVTLAAFCIFVGLIASAVEAVAASRYSLRSLLLFTVFMGCLVGFIATCAKEPSEFPLLHLIFTIGFLAATIASLLSDRKRLGKPGEIPPEARAEPLSPRGHSPGGPGDGRDGKADLP